MRDKIARAMCPKKDPELNCDDCVQELVCKPRIAALHALFTASQAELKVELLTAYETIKKVDSSIVERNKEIASCYAEIQAMRGALRTARDYVEDASNGKMGKHLVSMATKDLEEINKILGDRNG